MFISPISYCQNSILKYQNEKLFFNNTFFMGRQKQPVYIIDSDGNYQKYNSQHEAALALGVSKESIHISLKKGYGVKNCIVAKANEVETKMPDGSIIVDKKKIDDLILKKINAKAIYAIDSQGNYKKFNSQMHAAKELSLSASSISFVTSGKGTCSYGYTFVMPCEVETKASDGSIAVDEEKVRELSRTRVKNKAIYAIDSQGNYIKYNSQVQAAKDLGISPSEISNIIKEKQKTTSKEYTFVEANEVETKAPDGSIAVDEEKVKKIGERKIKDGAVYAIDAKGNYKRYNRQICAAEDLGISSGEISNIINNYRRKTARGYAFVSAKNIEIKLPDGSTIVDEGKIRTIQKRLIDKTSSKIDYLA